MQCKSPWAFSEIFLKLRGGLLLVYGKIVANYDYDVKRGGGLLLKHWLLLGILQ